MTVTTDLAPVLRKVLEAPDAREHLERYFREPGRGALAAGTYAGRLFERVGGGGDRPEVANRLTAEDLLAVECLSVQVPPEAAFELLHGALARRLSDILSQIPTGVRIRDDDAERHLADGSPADTAWRLLHSLSGVGWVTAGKLMARKRPALIPVYDQVTRCVLGAPDKVWIGLHQAMHEDRALTDRLERLAAKASVPARVTSLRTLDVILWMSHNRDHRKGLGCTAPHSAGDLDGDG
jgi:hypothetical protein